MIFKEEIKNKVFERMFTWLNSKFENQEMLVGKQTMYKLKMMEEIKMKKKMH